MSTPRPDERSSWASRALVLVALSPLVVGCTESTRMDPRVPESTIAAVDATNDGVTLNPYHAVVRGKVLRAFRGLTGHDSAPALSLMADDVHYTFEGEHALGGTRVTKAGVAKWFERLFRLLPGAFSIRSIEVNGFPWSTRVVTTFAHYVAPPGGEPYWGQGVQIVDLEWGEAKRIHTLVDTHKLVKTLDSMAAHGATEAHAAPILE